MKKYTRDNLFQFRTLNISKTDIETAIKNSNGEIRNMTHFFELAVKSYLKKLEEGK